MGIPLPNMAEDLPMVRRDLTYNYAIDNRLNYYVGEEAYQFEGEEDRLNFHIEKDAYYYEAEENGLDYYVEEDAYNSEAEENGKNYSEENDHDCDAEEYEHNSVAIPASTDPSAILSIHISNVPSTCGGGQNSGQEQNECRKHALDQDHAIPPTDNDSSNRINCNDSESPSNKRARRSPRRDDDELREMCAEGRRSPSSAV
eukprot:Gb_08782 [translate_table: standard]